ncbi:hypothetical protein CI15_27700 [Paraburkholderia monticola]|uniref:Enoyl-CoA hydratase n=1 Tax=Paraburkholderia monticola TaxID=1399968 RepID=A0A149PD03_9BURK|nr:hypothetical protein CI15_27700 [Paraburkholderia monticola]
MAKAYHAYEEDSSLLAAVLFGHGDHFSAGLDADAFAPALTSGQFNPFLPGLINPLQTSKPRLTKPVITVAHGNTFFMGHELFLAADIRVAAANAVFSQGETQRALFPGGGATIRFVREVGWAQAMRYMLTGDNWTAEEARGMRLVHDISATPESALELGIQLAKKIAAAAPLGTKATLASAHQFIDEGEEKAFAALLPDFVGLMKTEDFQERVRALKEQRPPVYVGR